MVNAGSENSRDQYLDYLARCRQAFTPFAPIELPEFFAGRADVIDDILGELAAPGRQIAIYGERGVGKSSLALLLYFFTKYDDENVHIYRCGDESTFDEICRGLVSKAGFSLPVNSVQTETSRSAKGALGPLGIASGKKSTVTYRNVEGAQPFTPSRMLHQFAQSKSLLIIDEYDRVRDERTNVKMAEMIKHFSDARSTSKIVIVGVAETLSQLIGEHESLSRSLAQINLERMNEADLRDITDRGAKRIGTSFDPEIARRIVCLADGFPHFVHLISLYACIAAGEVLRDAPSSPVVLGPRAYGAGLDRAIDKAEHTLHERYDEATVTIRRKSRIYELILCALALSEEPVVQIREIAEQASFLTGVTLRPEKFSNALGQLVKQERRCILTKVRDGYYKFTDPLMRTYVRFLLEQDNVTYYEGQREFPFMRPSLA